MPGFVLILQLSTGVVSWADEPLAISQNRKNRIFECSSTKLESIFLSQVIFNIDADKDTIQYVCMHILLFIDFY